MLTLGLLRSNLVPVQGTNRQTMDKRQIKTLLPQRFAKEIAGTRPILINCFLAQAPSDRIVMNVSDRGRNCIRCEQVAIELRTFLPKPETGFSRPFADRQVSG